MHEQLDNIKCTFVILHYGNIETTNTCIKSIVNQEDKKNVSIILLDNEVQKAIEDRVTLDDFETGHLPSQLIHVMEDGGFSHANNIGYQLAKEAGSDIVVVCNNDIELRDKTFVGDLKRKVDMDTEVMGPRIIHATIGVDQNPLDTRERTIREANSTILKNKIGLALFPAIFPILFVRDQLIRRKDIKRGKQSAAIESSAPIKNVVLSGSCLIFMPSFVKKEEFAFRPETHFYYEEYILFHRCMKAGYSTCYCPDLAILHESGKATQESFGRQKNKKRFEMREIMQSCKIYRDYLAEE